MTRIKNSLMRFSFWLFSALGLLIFILFHDHFVLALTLIPTVMFEGQEILLNRKKIFKIIHPLFSRLYVFIPIVGRAGGKIIWLKPKKKIVFFKNLFLFRLARLKMKSHRTKKLKSASASDFAKATSDKMATADKKETLKKSHQEKKAITKKKSKANAYLFNKILRKFLIRPLKFIIKLSLKILLLPLNIFKKMVKKILGKGKKKAETPRSKEDWVHQSPLDQREESGEIEPKPEVLQTEKIEEPVQEKQTEEEFKAGNSASFNQIKKQTVYETEEESEKNRLKDGFLPRNILKQATRTRRREKLTQIIKAVFLRPKLTRNMSLVLIFLILFGTFSAFVPRQYDEYAPPPADEQIDTEEGIILGEKIAIEIKTPLTIKEVIGRGFAAVALFFGLIFFIYSLKYYFSSIIVLLASQTLNGEKSGKLGKLFYRLFFRGKGKNGLLNNGNGSIGFLPNLTNGQKNGKNNWYPFVSIHLAFYNEKRVANRILTACTSFDYPNYEVIVADDSTDKTVEILDKWKKHSRVKIIHRDNRSGYKGMALQEAVHQMDPRTEFVVVFDADFIPYPDTLKQFLKYFQLAGGNGNGNDIKSYKDTNIAAVQGYQWHVLNKNENWITRAVRSEFAGSYVVERPGREIMGALKQIAGSVYMVRADVLKSYGWTDSLTEDFELTMRIHRDGWKVIFTPYIQAPAECVSTLKRLIRQRMRWAEGHTRNVRRYFWDLIKSPHMNRREKLEFFYLAPYYLQSAFLLIGTTCWFISDIVFHTQLPFWTALWGWSLVFVNLIALPFLNSIGLFFEESPEKDYLGIFSFVSLTYIIAPFQALAALKGLFQKKPGVWFRTPKSGHITDLYFRSRYRRWLRVLFPRKGRGKKRTSVKSPYLKLTTSNNQFSDFKVKKRSKGARIIKNLFIFFLLISSALIIFFSTRAESPFDISQRESQVTLKTINTSQLENREEKVTISKDPYDYVFETGFPYEQSQKIAQYIEAPSPQTQAKDQSSQTPFPALPGTSVPSATPDIPTAPDIPGIPQPPKSPPQETPESIVPPEAEEIDNPVLMAKSTIRNGEKVKPEYIFHPEPRVRVKEKHNEIEFKTLTSDGLGELTNASTGYKLAGQGFYPEIFEDVDLRYTMVHNGLLEEFIVNKPKEIKSISQELNLYEVELLNPDKYTAIFVDKKTKEEKFRFDIPKMYELNNQGKQSDGLHYELEKVNNGKYVISIVIEEKGQEWLSDPERNYPIAIDPSVIVSGGIDVLGTETNLGGQQQKLVFVNSAWYAFHQDGGRIAYHKCTDVTNKCDQATDWSAANYMGDGGDADNDGPDTWLDGNLIWVVWFDDDVDNITLQSIDTGNSDSLGTACSSGDMGLTSTKDGLTVSRGTNGDFVIGYDDDPDIFEVTGVTTADCTGSTWTDITAGSGMTSHDLHTATAVGNVVHMVWQEAGGPTGRLRHNYYDVSSNSWGTEVQVASMSDASYGLTSDSSGNLWLHALNGSAATALYKCAAPCTGTWVAQTAPWSEETNVIYATITYASTENDLIVSVIKDTSEQAYHKSSDASSISWGTEYSYGFTAGDLDHIASMERVSSAANAGVVLRQGSNFEFATVPERVISLILFALLLPWGLKKLMRRKQRKSFKSSSIFVFKKRK